MSKLATFWTGDLSVGFPAVSRSECLHDGTPTRKGLLKNIESLLAARWGGVTVSRVRGVWYDREESWQAEFGYKFEVYFDTTYTTLPSSIVESFSSNWILALQHDARHIANILKQEEVHITVVDAVIMRIASTDKFGA